MAVVKNLMVRAGADFSQLTKATTKANASLSGFKARTAKSMLGFKLAIAASLGAVSYAIKESVTMAAKVEGSMQQVNRSMGENSKVFLEWVKSNAMAFNMGKADAIQYGAVYGNLVSGFTKDTETTMKVTQDLLKASSIVASSTGRSMQDVMERMRSGMLGNTEAIEDVGIYAQVAMLKSTKAFKQLAGDKSWDQLDYQTQQQIRTMSILEQVYSKFGTEVQDNTNTRIQKFVAQLKNIQLGLGQAFLPIVNTVLPILTSFASGIAAAMNVFAQFTGALFGTEIKFGATAAEDQSAAVDDLGDSYKGAGKKAKNALAGFDEINQLQNSNSDGGSSAGTATTTTENKGDTSLYAKATEEIKKMSDSIKSFFAPLQNISFDNIKTALGKLQDALKPITATLFEGLKWGMENVIAPLSKFVIESVIPAFLDLLAGAFAVLNPLLQSFKPLAVFLFDNFLKPIASFTGGVIVKVIEGLAGALTKIGSWMSDNIGVVKGITTVIGGFFASWEMIEVMAFLGMAPNIVGAITKITAAIKAATLAKIADKAEVIALKLLYAKDFVVSLAAGTGALIKQTGAWIANAASVVASKVAYVAASTATKAMAVAQGALNIVMNANPFILVATLVAALGVALIALWKNNEGFRNAVTKAWESISKIATSVFEGVKNAIVGGVNAAINSINSLIKLINKIPGIEIPTFSNIGISTTTSVPKTGSPRIPKMATGGVVSRATNIIAGEAGAEAIVPLQNSAFIQEFSKSVAAAMGTASQGPATVVLKIGETELGRATIKAINNLQRQCGTTLLEV